MTIWKVTTTDNVGLVAEYFTTLELVRQSIDITYEKWTTKPETEQEGIEYVSWRVPNGSLIEASAITVKDRPDHL